MPEVDIAELEKQYEELGEMIKGLGGNVDVIDKAKGKGKGKKAAADEYDNMDAEDKADGGDDEDVEKAADLKKADLKKADLKKADLKKAADLKKVADLKRAGEVEKSDDDDEIEKAEDDEELVVKGQTIKKSAIGPVQFGLMKAMSEDLEKNTKDIAKAKDEATLAKLEKRADDEFKHVPGTVQDRAAMLKAVSEMPEPLKKAFDAVFKQSEALAKNAFDMKGSTGGDSEDIKKARQDFESKVSEIKKSDNCTRSEAMTKARQAHPDLFKAYQESSN